jgi:D-ribose pyranose/furanose isomerase RbsD
MLWKLSWESLVGIVSEGCDKFFTSKKTGKNALRIGEATPYFNLPEELKLMATTIETSSIKNTEPLSTSINHEMTGEDNLVLPQISSMVTIVRLGDTVGSPFRNVTVSNKTQTLI